MYACVYVFTCVHVYVYVYTYVHACVHAYMTCTDKRTDPHFIYVEREMHANICIYVYVEACISQCLRRSVCMRIIIMIYRCISAILATCPRPFKKRDAHDDTGTVG